jgi:hypothetical protein
MEVAGSQESLARVDDAKQEELLAAYAQLQVERGCRMTHDHDAPVNIRFGAS